MKRIILILTCLIAPLVYASGDDCQRGHNQCGHDDDNGDGTQVTVEGDTITIEGDTITTEGGSAEANASAEGGDGGDGGQGGSVKIDARRPGNSYIGGGNSTAGEQKVFAIGGGWLTGNASFRFDLTDKDARKLRIARDWREWGMSDFLVNKMQCSAKIVYKPFGSSKKCEAALKPKPEPELVDLITLTHDEYHELTMAQVSKEEYEDQQELVEYRYEQQQVLIESLEEEAASDDSEIKALKKKVNDALVQRDERDVKEAAKKASFQEIFDKRYAEVAQAEEPEDE